MFLIIIKTFDIQINSSFMSTSNIRQYLSIQIEHLHLEFATQLMLPSVSMQFQMSILFSCFPVLLQICHLFLEISILFLIPIYLNCIFLYSSFSLIGKQKSSGVRRVESHLFQGSGHVAHFKRHPKLYTQLVQTFMDSVEQSPEHLSSSTTNKSTHT